MRYGVTFLIVLLITTLSCVEEPDNSFDFGDLVGNWTHSYEEETNQSDQIFLYRPSNYKEFPITRYRRIYRIYHKNNSCEVYQLAANDAHFFESCTWSTEEINNEVFVTINFESSGKEEFKIIEISDDLLEIEYVNGVVYPN